ncbi:MAG: carbohydrate kinase family protein [Candidatus Berkelbacteria bacterium]|nr:carbohydrate kinase family protein [Candidatus Berkelbacteria bacterium]
MLNGKIAATGHICVDLRPPIPVDHLPDPGKLVQVGPLQFSAGGAVSNVGITAAKIGISTLLMGKVGDDFLGTILRSILESHTNCSVDGMIVSPRTSTSYSVVLEPEGKDRAFLHYPGPNNTFRARDIDYKKLGDVDVFHFGYPPLMRFMFSDYGEELERTFSTAKKYGVITSLDMVEVGSNSLAAKADWETILLKTLPHVDLFTPSIGEITALVPRFKNLDKTSPSSWREISDTLIHFGASAVLLKLGRTGLYLRTSSMSDSSKVSFRYKSWADKEMLSVPFREKERVGTTGTGDTAIAGFLVALLQGHKPEACLQFASGVSTCCVEAPDATSGVCSWEKTWERINSGWSLLLTDVDLSSWKSSSVRGVYVRS